MREKHNMFWHWLMWQTRVYDLSIEDKEEIRKRLDMYCRACLMLGTDPRYAGNPKYGTIKYNFKLSS